MDRFVAAEGTCEEVVKGERKEMSVSVFFWIVSKKEEGYLKYEDSGDEILSF